MAVVIRTYQACCAEVVGCWDGHIAKFFGDGVLVFFGYPQAHEDDAERAVHAGLELAEKIAQLTTEDGTPLAARSGIATGLLITVLATPFSALRKGPDVDHRYDQGAPGTTAISTRRFIGSETSSSVATAR